MAPRDEARSSSSKRGSVIPREDIWDLLARPFKSVASLFLQSELDLLHAIQKGRRKLPLPVRWIADRLICAHPLYDFSLVVWVCTLVALYYVSWGLMWTLVANVFVSFLLAMFVGGPVPAGLDRRIKPRGRASPSGFPCVELHLATVCLVVCVKAFPHPGSLSGGVAIWTLLAMLRLYGVTHFPHQLILSTALGLLSIPVCEAFGDRMVPRGMHKHLHIIGMCLCGAVMLAYVAYKAENNDSPVFRLPREEFTRVLSDIMAGDDAAVNQRIAAIEADEAKDESARVNGTRRRKGKGEDTAAAQGTEAETAWRGDANSIGKGASASVRGPPAGPQTGGPGRPPAGPGGSPVAGSARLPPAGPMGGYTSAYGADSRMVIPAVPDSLARYAEDEEYEEEGGDDDRTLASSGLVSGSNPGSVSYPSASTTTTGAGAAVPRPARDSMYYLMRGMERRAHTKALEASRDVLGMPTAGTPGTSTGGTRSGSEAGESRGAASALSPSTDSVLSGRASFPTQRPRPARAGGGPPAGPSPVGGYASSGYRTASQASSRDPMTAAYWGYGEEEED